MNLEVEKYVGELRDLRSNLSVIDMMAMSALPSVITLYGQNQPFVIAEECYSIARAMMAQKEMNNGK